MLCSWNHLARYIILVDESQNESLSMSTIQDALKNIEASQSDVFDLTSLEYALGVTGTRSAGGNDCDDSSPEKNSPTSSLRHSMALSAPQSPSSNETPTKLYCRYRRRHQRHRPPRTSSPREKIPIYCRRLFRWISCIALERENEQKSSKLQLSFTINLQFWLTAKVHIINNTKVVSNPIIVLMCLIILSILLFYYTYINLEYSKADMNRNFIW